MSESVQVELIKQLPLVLVAFGAFMGTLGTLWLQIVNRKEILEVKHATNSFLDQRVHAAKAEGRLDERSDQLAREHEK